MKHVNSSSVCCFLKARRNTMQDLVWTPDTLSSRRAKAPPQCSPAARKGFCGISCNTRLCKLSANEEEHPQRQG